MHTHCCEHDPSRKILLHSPLLLRLRRRSADGERCVQQSQLSRRLPAQRGVCVDHQELTGKPSPALIHVSSSVDLYFIRYSPPLNIRDGLVVCAQYLSPAGRLWLPQRLPGNQRGKLHRVSGRALLRDLAPLQLHLRDRPYPVGQVRLGFIN